MLDKCLEQNTSCFFEPAHAFSDFNIEISVFGDVVYVVLNIDILKDKLKMYTHVSEG